jgi:tyrosyl-tRNA synthetase
MKPVGHHADIRSVKNKMSKGDGMSYAEFSYPLMQAWDWWHMYHSKGIQMQIGGSDQYGNITAGIAAIKYISSHHPDPYVRGQAHAVGEPMGFTVPLLTTSSGQKFGKSAGNAIWLDSSMTSSFDLYGYFLRTSDEDVGKYLKMFTFMPLEDIDALLEAHKKSPSQRKAQHQLARDFVELVHGAKVAKDTEVQHRLVFKSILKSDQPQPTTPDPSLEAPELTSTRAPSANMKLPRSLIMSKSIGKILYASGLAQSASEGHRLASKNGAYIGGHPDKKQHGPMPEASISWSQIQNWDPKTTKSYLVHGDLLLLRRSKHNIRIIHVVPDEEYVMTGENYPGMDSLWRIDILTRMAVKEEITKEEREAVEKMLEEAEAREAFLAASPDKSSSPPVKVGDGDSGVAVKASANP